MGVYTLINNADRILKEKTEAFNFDDPQIPPEQLAAMLADTMCLENGIGLVQSKNC